MTALEKYLTSISEGMKKLGAKACFDEFMLRNGRSFMGRPLPLRYRLRMPKMCYWNTYRLVTKSKTLRYCEGYVMCSDLPIPIQHAWAIDVTDQIVDVTLDRPAISEYFGIVLERHQLDPEREGSGMLWDHLGVPNLELWYQIDPGFKELAEP